MRVSTAVAVMTPGGRAHRLAEQIAARNFTSNKTNSPNKLQILAEQTEKHEALTATNIHQSLTTSYASK